MFWPCLRRASQRERERNENLINYMFDNIVHYSLGCNCMYGYPNCHSSTRRHFDTADLDDRMEALLIVYLIECN